MTTLYLLYLLACTLSESQPVKAGVENMKNAQEAVELLALAHELAGKR